ncbi:MAG TPA: condensation domain-containing protein, partial [Saprospiraceae bacterium]|nr:condensation domain-containing protein [Saprospiraceae bacterium]
IIKQSEELNTVLITGHHSILDGWSLPVLLMNLHRYYHGLAVERRVAIVEDSAYLRAQEYVCRAKGAVQAYWDKLLANVGEANDINALLSKPIDALTYRQVGRPAGCIVKVTGENYKALKALSKKAGVTLNVIVQFAWHKLLQVYSGRTQSIVGTTISGRDLPIEGIENSVGLYINTLPLVIDWENENTILGQLHQIHQRVVDMNAHSFADLAKLQKDGQRLFHSLLFFENYPIEKGEDKCVPVVSVRNVIEKVDYPLSILAYEHNDALTVSLQYDGEHLSEEKAKYHVATLEKIIHQVIRDPNQLHKKISLLSAEEYDQVVYRWNGTDKEYPNDKTIHELFQDQAGRTPAKIALVYEEDHLTYKDLNARSNQLARHIRGRYLERCGKEMEPDTLIALCLDRSLEMVVGILGVLKAGGAYVPIDP